MMAAAAACGFPEASFLPEGVVAEGGVDAAEDVPAIILEGGATPPEEAGRAGDAGIPIDAAGCTTCDCDDDLYDRFDEDAGCDGGGFADGGKKGIDCDDRVAAVHPNQGFLEEEDWLSTHLPAFDWDCNGLTVKQSAFNGQCGLGACRNGFEGDPPCGGTAKFSFASRWPFRSGSSAAKTPCKPSRTARDARRAADHFPTG